MGLFDFLTGSRRPAAGVRPRSGPEVRAALLATNRPSAPWLVRDGGAEGVDLVGEWRITDPRWREVFAAAAIARTIKLLMRLDAERTEVRAAEQDWGVEDRDGAIALFRPVTMFRGEPESWIGKTPAFSETDAHGKVHPYHFEHHELNPPLQNATTASGWTWRGVAFRKL